MNNTRNYVDFETIKENWNKYTLKEGTRIKLRTLLRSAWYMSKDEWCTKIFF